MTTKGKDPFAIDDSAEEATGRGLVVSRNRMAVIMGASTATIGKWVKQGCPVVSKAAKTIGWKLNTADVIAWVRSRDVELSKPAGDDDDAMDNAKTREREATARLKEMEIARREGELVDSSVFVAWAETVFGEVRSRILQVESQVTNLNDDQREQLQQSLNDALSDLSLNKLTDGMVDYGTVGEDDNDSEVDAFRLDSGESSGSQPEGDSSN